MKNLKKLLVILLALCLTVILSVSAAAQTTPYTYTVRIFAGAQGTIAGEPVVVYSNLTYGSRVNFDVSQVELSDNSKYYVKGIRESGKDNSTVGNPSILVEGDEDYVVAYGLLGDSVAYTVLYLDADGNELLPSGTFYGNIGDKAVVAYKYIDGYQPQAYNLGRTLSANAAENVFPFYYTPVAEGEEGLPEGGQTPAAPGEAAGPGAGTTPGEGPEAAGPGTVIPPAETVPEEQTPESQGPQEYEELDEPDTPLAEGNKPVVIEACAEFLSSPVRIGIAAGSLGLIGLMLWLILYKRHKEKNKDEGKQNG